MNPSEEMYPEPDNEHVDALATLADPILSSLLRAPQPGQPMNSSDALR